MPREPASDVRANTEYTAASGAFEMNAFSPVSRNPPSTGTADSASDAASEPASGSVSANPTATSPAAICGIHSSTSSAEPASRIGYAPSPCNANAVSASVHCRASPSRIRHSAIADVGS